MSLSAPFLIATIATISATVTTSIYLSYRASPPIHCSEADHRLRLSRLIASLRSRPPGSKLSLQHRTLQSHTIKNANHKQDPLYYPVDLSSFNHIIEIDSQQRYVICEPGVSFGNLLRELAKHGMTTLVVPELPGITVGGAISGGGLESSSHKYGQVSDTVLEIECLTPTLRVCSPQVDSDLFYAISASYNTCAVMTRIKLRITPAPRYVSLRAIRYDGFDEAVEALQMEDGSDTIEGIAYSAREILVIRGRHVEEAITPIRKFTRHWDRWYYKSIRSTHNISVPYYDYCFRYDYGSFWMADYVLEMLGGDNLFTRFLFGTFLDTEHLFAVLHSAKLTDLGRARVIQDCYIPAPRAVDFLESQEEEMGIYPLWLCPIKGTSTSQVLSSHYSPTNQTFINIGIYGQPRQFPFDPEVMHRRLVDRLVAYGGRSMLYAQSWHTSDQFEAIYGDAERQVDKIVKRNDGEDCFFGLYDKVTLSATERMGLAEPMLGTEAEENRKVVKDILSRKLRSLWPL
jgi:delta24-sterol reductase